MSFYPLQCLAILFPQLHSDAVSLRMLQALHIQTDKNENAHFLRQSFVTVRASTRYSLKCTWHDVLHESKHV